MAGALEHRRRAVELAARGCAVGAALDSAPQARRDRGRALDDRARAWPGGPAAAERSTWTSGCRSPQLGSISSSVGFLARSRPRRRAPDTARLRPRPRRRRTRLALVPSRRRLASVAADHTTVTCPLAGTKLALEQPRLAGARKSTLACIATTGLPAHRRVTGALAVAATAACRSLHRATAHARLGW
jgi:hypothetical protein